MKARLRGKNQVTQQLIHQFLLKVSDSKAEKQIQTVTLRHMPISYPNFFYDIGNLLRKLFNVTKQNQKKETVKSLDYNTQICSYAMTCHIFKKKWWLLVELPYFQISLRNSWGILEAQSLFNKNILFQTAIYFPLSHELEILHHHIHIGKKIYFPPHLSAVNVMPVSP